MERHFVVRGELAAHIEAQLITMAYSNLGPRVRRGRRRREEESRRRRGSETRHVRRRNRELEIEEGGLEPSIGNKLEEKRIRF